MSYFKDVNIQVGHVDVADGNPVPVSDAGSSLTIDGTIAVSSGSIAVTNTVAVTESSPISGFATSAKQLADGHNVTVDNISTNEVFIRGSQAAGSPVDNELVTVQGIASMTPLAVTESSPITGFATSAKQLADGHNVTVDNAGGASAVNIQDGGNTITVDGTITVSSGSIDVTNTVTIAPDKASSAGTSSGVSVGAASTTVLAANASRKQAILVNDSDEEMYLKYGTTAVSHSGIRLNSYGGTVVEDIYQGIITGICASGTKTITVTEM